MQERLKWLISSLDKLYGQGYIDVERIFSNNPEGKKLSKKEREFLAALKSQVEGDID